MLQVGSPTKALTITCPLSEKYLLPKSLTQGSEGELKE